MKVYAFVGPSGTGKSYRAQMVANEKGINFIIDDKGDEYYDIQIKRHRQYLRS